MRDAVTTLARPDLASRALEGLVRAERFAPVRVMQAAVPLIYVRSGPAADAPTLVELAFGEVFDVLETDGVWAWGQARRDGIVGWASLASLSEHVLAPTHTVWAGETIARAEPDAASAPGPTLGMNALLTVEREQGDWLFCVRAGWLAAADLRPIGTGFDTEAQVAVARLKSRRRLVPPEGPALARQAQYACGRAAS